MLKLDKAVIPDAHIMKRWTRDARDVLPDELKAYQRDQEALQSTTFRNRLMRLQSVKLVAKGDTDVELFEIVMKHMKAAEKETDEVIAGRLKNTGVVQEEDSSDDEVEDKNNSQGNEHDNVGVQSDGELLRKNKYGASGSSAGLSDSEIRKFRAPVLEKVRGSRRSKRFIAGSESSKKKWKKKKKTETHTPAAASQTSDLGTGGKESQANRNDVLGDSCLQTGEFYLF